MRILFIGNSHTYFNNLPELVAKGFREIGIDCEVTMLAHGGWFLEQHTKEPDVQFNIRFGHYDYVVLQEHSHPFGPIEKYEDAVTTLSERIKEAGSTPVIYATWSKKDEAFEQERMNIVHREAAEKNGALLAPVGEFWWDFMQSHPEIEMYASDGAHASPAGSEFAAAILFRTIWKDFTETPEEEPELRVNPPIPPGGRAHMGGRKRKR